MPHEHPPPPPPPGNKGATLWYISTVLNNVNYTDDAKFKAIKKATE
jgi:hypothetical protein